jgi:hypothetical protein
MQHRHQTELTTIGLAGDLDDVELIEVIESSFGIDFGDSTVEWYTVGDIHDALLSRFPVRSARPCATAMAFYRIRASLRRMSGIEKRISPSTKLAALTDTPPKRLFIQLSEELGVANLPAPMSWRGDAGAIALMLGLPGVFLVAAFFHSLWPALLLIPLGLALIATDVGAYGTMTVGDLAHTAVSRNFSRFASIGAASGPTDIWQALIALIGDETGNDPSRITRKTKLLA